MSIGNLRVPANSATRAWNTSPVWLPPIISRPSARVWALHRPKPVIRGTQAS